MEDWIKKSLLRNKLLKEGFFDRLGEIVASGALKLKADYHERAAAIAHENYQRFKREKEERLFPIYAQHLGMSHNELKTIFNEYPKKEPHISELLQRQHIVTDSGDVIPNPSYPSVLRNWEIRKRQFSQRQEALRKIAGFHKFNPRIREISNNYSRLMKLHKDLIDKHDPIINVGGMPMRTSAHLRIQADRQS